MFKYKETMYFVIFEILLSSFSVYQLTVAIMTKAKEIEHNQIEVKFERIETFKKIKSDVREIEIEEKPKNVQIKIEEQSKNIEPIINIVETKIEKKEIIEIPKIINNQTQKKRLFMPKQLNMSIESDDADIIWFEE